jgi:glycoprotein-N-acetylgalactosamine 3-beta-galactosyltransferase
MLVSVPNKNLSFLAVTVLSIVLFSTLFIKFNDGSTLKISLPVQYVAPLVSSRSNSLRILCLVLTSPKTWFNRAKAVNATWGPRCDRYYFVTEPSSDKLSSEQKQIIESMPVAPIPNITAGYDHLTRKSNLALLFAHDQHLNDFDWFVKADDDTYLIVDHLRDFLSEQNASEPVTFGYNFKVDESKSGG